MPSEVVGTTALWIALAIATVVALTSRPSAAQLRHAAAPAVATLTLQALHFGE